MSKYIVVDIGCIECGEPSCILGIFTDKEKAYKVRDKYKEIQSNYWSGQHYFEVYEVSKENEELFTEEDYKKYLEE